MAVVNKICSNCNKSLVCAWCKVIDKFDDEVSKNPINTVIEIKECPEFDEVRDLAE
jgi:hypothetical protein